MKKLSLMIFAVLMCLSAFSGCAKKCEHNWQRTANFDQHTAVDKCAICEETRMYTDPDAISAEVQLPAVPTIFPFEPPHLFVIGNKNAVDAWRGTSSWMAEGEDGIGSGIESDSPHPLECKDDLPILEITKKTTVNLKFEAAPSKITVKRYKASTTDFDNFDELTVSGNLIEVKAGNYVYEIIASWSGQTYNGTVYYAFRTEK